MREESREERGKRWHKTGSAPKKEKGRANQQSKCRKSRREQRQGGRGNTEEIRDKRAERNKEGEEI